MAGILCRGVSAVCVRLVVLISGLYMYYDALALGKVRLCSNFVMKVMYVSESIIPNALIPWTLYSYSTSNAEPTQTPFHAKS